MIEVEVHGFQSIEHVAFKVEGFTALVGRSNIGKSAIVRAIKAALTNALGTSFVRHGHACLRRTKGVKTCKCETMVRITAEGFDLKWRKGDAVNEYVFNGKTMTVPGRGFPEFLSPAFAPVKLGENQKLLQVADQFFPIFLLDQSGSTVANILSDVARLDAVNVAMKHVEKDRKEAASLRKVRDKDVEVLAASLTVYDGLDSALSRCDAVAAEYERLDKADRTVGHVTGLCSRLTSLVTDIRALQGVDKITVPDAAEVRRKSTDCVRAASLHERLVECATAYRALEGSAKIVAPDAQPLVEGHKSLQRVRAFALAHEEHTHIVAALDGVDDVVLPDVQGLVERTRRQVEIGSLSDRLELHTKAVKNLDAVEAITAPDSTPIETTARATVLVAGWINRMREFRSWFDERKDAEHAIVPEAGPLQLAGKALAVTTDLSLRHTALTSTIEALDRQHTEIAVEQAAAEAALAAFIAEAQAKGWICGECAQPLQGGHVHKGAKAK